MNERFMFRGKEVRTSDHDPNVPTIWFYGVPIMAAQAWCIHYIDKEGYRRYEPVEPATIGQCTGLTDRDGALIFEGDVADVALPNDTGRDVGFIEWQDEYGVFIVRFTPTKLWYMSPLDTIKVIGNIHDNPELLRTDANEQK